MDVIALAVEVFGVASLSVAFAKYSLERRAFQADDNMRNNNLTFV
jgi:hypothetical protein